MVKEGKKTKAKQWGWFTVVNVVELEKPVPCYSSAKGSVEFKPTIVKIKMGYRTIK